MNKNYLISVITPIYNAETYLSETIESIIKQSIGFENIELILIDDKSTDNSREVISEYASKYNNIRPIYLDKNSGFPGFVRNQGLEVATADYIMFIDSDDEYEIDMCERLYKTLIETNCDCVGCNFIRVEGLSKNKTKKSNDSDKTLFLDSKEALYYNDIYVWNKIFKKSLIKNNNIKFVTDRIGEDTFFCIEYYIHSKSIVFLENYFGYKYFNREESFSTTNLEWNLKVIEHYYYSLNILNKYDVKIDQNIFFKSSIHYSIISTIKMEENDWSSIFKVLTEIYLFGNKINFKPYHIDNLLIKFIAKLILSNHISTATLITLILNHIVKKKFVLKFYRKTIGRL